MNKHFLFVSFMAVAVFAATACDKEPAAGGTIKDFSLSVQLPSDSPKQAWDASDKVLLISQEGSLTPPTATLSTSGAGSATASFGASSVTAGNAYWGVYPAGAVTVSSSTSVFAIVPTEVTGPVDAASLLHAGSVSSTKQTLALSPAVAFVTVRLDGAETASILSLTLSSDAYIAGDVRLSGLDGSTLSVASDATRNRAGQQRSIEMRGTFQPGDACTFAVIPGEAKELTLEARSLDGRYWSVPLGGATLRAGGTLDLGTKTPAFTGSSDFLPVFTATQPGIKPYVLVFTPEAFTEGTGVGTREDYTQAAIDAANYIFEVEPFRHFKSYFSVYVAWRAAESQQVGSPWGVTQSAGGSFNSMGNGRSAVYNWVGERCPEVIAGTTPLDNVGVIMLIYTPSYAGAVCDWEDSGRFVALVDYSPALRFGSLAAGVTPQTYGATNNGRIEGGDNGTTITLSDAELRSLGYTTAYGSNLVFANDYRGVCLHEGMGHGFTRLMDEYWITADYTFPNGYWYTDLTSNYHRKKFPSGLNISDSPTDVPWKNLLSLQDELVAKDARYARTGAYQGGLVTYMWGVWRPERVSVMMDCRPYFATWQRALVYQRLMRSTGAKPDCDVRNSMDDLRAYLDIDLQIEGIKDPVRD